MSNNRENAVQEIKKFLDNTDEKTILIKGTHQYEKHSLVLQILESRQNLKKGLFRLNSLENTATFLQHAKYKVKPTFKPKSGQMYRVGSLELCFDNMFNKRTWSNAPHDLDFAIIYPMDSFCEKDVKSKNEFIEDIYEWKKFKKVFVITWTDIRHDYSWLDSVIDRQVIFDVEEEDPDYHKRVLGLK